MTLDQFWNTIELSWKDSPDLHQRRQKALQTNDYEPLAALSIELEDTILKNYCIRPMQLDKEAFTSFILHLEERINHIDSKDIHEYTDGSNDGFLYCRCFIVGIGKEYLPWWIKSRPTRRWTWRRTDTPCKGWQWKCDSLTWDDYLKDHLLPIYLVLTVLSKLNILPTIK